MATNTGIPYELITQWIFQKIHNQDSAHNVQVRQNVTLPGKTLSHQIDVFWEFEFGGIQYTTVVQTKDWSKPVDQGELLKFQAVLSDLPGQPRGILVTRTGYQTGAAEYARANGILLYELTETLDPPPPPIILNDVSSYATLETLGIVESGSGRTFVFEIVTFVPEFSNEHICFDKEWFHMIESRFNNEVATEVLSTRVYGPLRDISLYDENGNQTGTLRDVFAKFVDEMRVQSVLQRDATASFEQSTFLRTSSIEVPLAKVAAISTHIDIRKTVHRRLGLPDFVEFALKNLSDGTVKLFRRSRQSSRIQAPNDRN